MPDKKRALSPLKDPDRWRKSAAEMRNLAQSSTGDARESFTKLATEYDKLAERATARTRAKTSE